MESVIGLFRERLFTNFYKWLEANREALGEKWQSQLMEKAKEAEDTCDTAVKVTASALWMFNMMANCGVMAGVGPEDVSDQTDYENTKLDQESTKRMLMIIQACLNLQHLPREEAAKEIPIISRKHFSLKLFAKQHR